VHAFSAPVTVVNTGGWVVDTPQLNPLKGASLILIDEKLNLAAVRCYTEGPDASSYQLRTDPPSSTASNELVDELRTIIDPSHDPWASLAQVIRETVVDRGRQLADRLHADASTLDQLNQKVDPARGPTAPPG
jgi:hypothetical protein